MPSSCPSCRDNHSSDSVTVLHFVPVLKVLQMKSHSMYVCLTSFANIMFVRSIQIMVYLFSLLHIIQFCDNATIYLFIHFIVGCFQFCPFMSGATRKILAHHLVDMCMHF